jgi:hypothetical protein
MPPTFAYVMCLMAYLAAMLIALVLCIPLFLVPSKRRLALRLSLAILASLPGLLVFQFVVGLALGVLLLAVLSFYAVFHPPDWVQWIVGIPTILIMFVSLVAASLWGCYTGGRIGWDMGGGKPFRTTIKQQKVVQLAVSYFRRNKV